MNTTAMTTDQAFSSFNTSSSSSDVDIGGGSCLKGWNLWQRSSTHNISNTNPLSKSSASTTLSPPPVFVMDDKTQQVVVDDTLLVKELNELSVNEREQVYNEIHGVTPTTCDQQETPEFIQTCCTKLLEELKKVPRRKRRAYERAVFLKPTLETDTKFQLMFLRAERYDAVGAAKRLCCYFTSIPKLFGNNGSGGMDDSKLVKDLTLEDLNPDGWDVIRNGGISVLPEKDQSGRTVLWADVRKISTHPWQDVAAAFWYVSMSCIQDNDEAQKAGFVHVRYCVGMNGAPPGLMEIVSKASPLLHESLPMRVGAVHVCFDHPTLAPALSLFQLVIGTQNRIRFRPHYGSHVEAQYNLLTFGIRVPNCFIYPDPAAAPDKDLKVMTDNFFAKRKAMEATQATKQKESLLLGVNDVTTLFPESTDVLLGRGSSYSVFGGNQNMTALLADYRDRYFSRATRDDKTLVALEVVQRIHDQGGRFLERVDGQGWKSVNNERARSKVVHAFRYGTKHTMNNNNEEEEQQHLLEPENNRKRLRVSPTIPTSTTTSH